MPPRVAVVSVHQGLREHAGAVPLNLRHMLSFRDRLVHHTRDQLITRLYPISSGVLCITQPFGDRVSHGHIAQGDLQSQPEPDLLPAACRQQQHRAQNAEG
jgi:hypothetical protein